MRRILYVHHCTDLGGASLSLLSLIEHLDSSRYEPSVLFNCHAGEAMTPFIERGVRIFQDDSIGTYPHGQGAWLSLRSLRPWEIATYALRVPGSARRFRGFLERHRFDLVHLNSSVQVPAALGTRSAGVPLVWHVREELHPGYLGIRRAWVRSCIARCSDAIVVISRRNADQLIPSEKVRVVYNFLDFGRFDRNISGSSFRAALNLPARCPLVLMLGGVIHSKGADRLVEAAAQVSKERPEVLFLVAGLPPTGVESPSMVKRVLRRAAETSGWVRSVERRIRKLMRRGPLERTVRFLGMRRDVPEMLAACDLLVWPASVSHFARPIIEAGAMARPVVASDFPSSRELVHAGETGLLVPPGDSRSLADAILHVLGNPDEGRRMGEAGYRLARERYDARVNAEAILSIYDRLLEGRPPAGSRV